MRFKEQRIGVFVDVANLYFSAKVMYQKKVNFKEVLKAAVDGRKLIRATAYVIKAESPEEQGFFDALENQGYQVKKKDLQVFYGGHKKGDWDVGLAMDAIKLAPKLDAIVIASGDGDYLPLVEYLQNLGQQVEIVAFGRSTSGKLIEKADFFLDLDQDAKKFLLAERKRRSEEKE